MHSPHLSPRLKRSQDLMNEPAPVPEPESGADSEAERSALPMCSLCPSGGSS